MATAVLCARTVRYAAKGSPREWSVWGLLIVVGLSWALNDGGGSVGILSLLSPIMAWSMFPFAVRFGKELSSGLVIAALGILATATALVAAATVIYPGAGLYDRLFGYDAMYLGQFSTELGAGRGMTVVTTEGLLLLGFSIMLAASLISRRLWWLAFAGAVLIGLRLFTA
jgi:hypothetical protein